MYDISTSNYLNTVVEASAVGSQNAGKIYHAFITQNIVESAEVVRMYDRLKVLMKTLNISSVKDTGSNNSQSAFMALNLIYSLDKIAKCWVDAQT